MTTTSNLTVESPANITIPGHTVQLITGKLCSTCEDVSAVLVEPSTKLPTHVCLARSLGPLTNGADVVLQVLNISLTPITIYKGMKLAMATPKQCVLLVSFADATDISHLTPDEQANLTSLLMDFSGVFSHENIPMGHTSVVKHSIPTTASPIRQPLRRIPQALKGAVSNEVHRMLDHNIIRPSNSPWLSLVIMVWKKDGSWRFCFDYHKLYAVIVVMHTHYHGLTPLLILLQELLTLPLWTWPLDTGRWQ